MTIESRIRGTTGIILVFVLIIGSILLWNSRQVENGIDQIRTSSQVVRSAFLLRTLMDEYLDYGDERPLRQWHKRNEFLGRIINEIKEFQSIDQALLKDLEIKYQAVNSLHPQIIQLGSSGEQRPNLRALHQTLVGTMSVQLEELVNAAELLHTASQSLTLRKQKLAQTLILSTSLLMIGLIALILYQIKKTIVSPLQELSRGAEMIGEGNFNYFVEIKKDDEVGRLSKAFNTMSERLRTSYDSLHSEIRERKRAEEELIRSNEDLQQFAYVASHDLQEPLRNVASCLQLLEKKYKNNLDAKADQYIHYAVESSVRMKTLILDLLTYSRIGTKGKPPQRLDCELILDQTVKNLRSAISETGAVITHDPLPAVLADDAQLSQVFQNLIGNGIKFRREEQPHIHVSAVKNKTEWIFSVKDNGIGIESRHLDRIFVIFQRLHKRSQYGGTGIGLAIVKKVVERHNGRVWVESEFGSGTTFYFTLPEKGIQA
jgi:signal transduction histidine kinase